MGKIDMGHIYQRRRGRTGLLLAVSAVVALTACGNEELAADAPATDAGDTADDAAEPPADAETLPTSMIVDATEFRFDAPARVAAGAIEITLTNSGGAPHHAQVARLNDGTTMEDLAAAFQEGEAAAMALITLEGGPATVDPSGQATAVLDLQPGTHVFLCFIPDAEGVPHLAQGMVQPFEVVEADASGTMPDSDGEITLADFSIALPDGFDGTGSFRVTNEGPQPHEVNFIRLTDGATAEDAGAWMQQPAGPPPFQSVGGMQALMVDGDGIAELDLAAGDYAAWCVIPDFESGKSHAELGMVTSFTVE